MLDQEIWIKTTITFQFNLKMNQAWMVKLEIIQDPTKFWGYLTITLLVLCYFTSFLQ